MSVSVSKPVELPTAVDENVTLIVHERPGPSDVPQSFVCANVPAEPELATAAMLVKASGMFPVFMTLRLGAVPVPFTRMGPNEIGDRGTAAMACAPT